MIYTSVDSALWYLPMQFLPFKRELRFMRTYLIYVAMSKDIPSGSGSVLINNFETAIVSATKDLSSARREDPSAVDPVVSCMTEKVKDCQQEIRNAYTTLWDQPWKSTTPPIRLAVMDFVDSVLHNLEDLLGAKLLTQFIRRNIESLQEKLCFIRDFIYITEKRRVEQQKMGAFLTYVQVVATCVACLSYWSWIDEVDQSWSFRMASRFSDLLQLIKPFTSDRIDMYFELLRASRTDENEIQSFVNFLLGNSVASVKSQTDSIREGLIYLIKFLMELPDQCTEDLGHISADIRAVAKEAGSFHLSNVKDEEVDELSTVLSRFLEKIMLLKQKISQIQQQLSERNLRVLRPKDESVIDLDEKPEFGSTFSSHSGEENREDGKQLGTHFEPVANEVTFLTCSIHDNKLTEEMATKMNHDLFALMESIESIKPNIQALQQKNNKPDMMHSINGQIESLHQGLKFLTKFILSNTDIEGDLKDGKLFSAHLIDVINESSSIISSFHVDEMTEHRADEVSNSLFKLLGKMNFIKSELFLLGVRNDKVGLVAHVKDQAETLQEGLRFLRSFLMNPPREHKEEGEHILTKSEALANEAASLICSFFENEMTEEIAMEMNLMISELLGTILLLKEKILQVYLQVPQSLHSNLPDGLVFISSLLVNTRALLNRKAHLVGSLKHPIEMLLGELESLKSFLPDSSEERNEHPELKDLCTCIVDVAYEAEYMIDSSVIGNHPEWYFMLWFPLAMGKIKLINSRVEEISDENMFDRKANTVTKSCDHLPSRFHNIAIGELVVGFDSEVPILVDLLITGKLKLDIISIVGPPGSGKTTLANKVYSSRIIAYHFRNQVWCSFSQEYRRRDMFLDILGSLIDDTSGISKMSDVDIATELRQNLLKNKFLIVMDNVWHTEALEDLRRVIPDDHNGSRVLLTSRLRYVAHQADPLSEPYPLRLLSTGESWMLLQRKIFLENACPLELVEVGKQISMRCKGMPLLVVIMAGLLASIDKTVISWKQVATSFLSGSFIQSSEDAFEIAYRYLPVHLKPCFLYFGAFPMNEEISVSKLLRIWIAEEFVKGTELKSLEHVAEDYLFDLTDRNLVTIAKRSSRGAIKACRVHDLIWDLCISKAKEEDFLHKIHGDDSSQLAFASRFEQRRLCIGIDRMHLTLPRPYTPCIRCLLCSASSEMNPELSSHVSFISCNFKLLRVLDLESINMGTSFPSGLQLLELLRYLAVRGRVNYIPSWIANLWNLETFIVKGLRGEVKIPNSFWNMQSLRHVYILPRFAFSLQDDEPENFAVLDKVVSLSAPNLSHGKYTEKLLNRFPKLQKLSCIFVPSWDNLRNCYKFPALDLLHQLRSLKISSHGRLSYPVAFNLPVNIKKLTLSRFHLPWPEISTIGRLPNLEVLKLLVGAFEGKVWDVQEDHFYRLKYLKLDSLNIRRWEAFPEAFLSLERVVLHRCWQLEEIPSSFADLPSLQMIEVQSCRPSAVASARRILEEQMDMGNDEIQLIVDEKGEF